VVYAVFTALSGCDDLVGACHFQVSNGCGCWRRMGYRHRVDQRDLAEALATHGLAPEQIDTVFVSHLHWDHIENIDLFRHAEILVPRLEFEYAAAIRPSDWGTPPYAREMLEGMRIVLLDDREQEIFPGVRTLPLPGHSVGLQGLVVGVEGGDLVLASDALWSARDAVRGHPDVAFFDPEKGKASLMRALAAGAVYYPGHDRPFTLKQGHVTYLTQYTYHLRFSFQPDGQDIRTMISTEERPQTPLMAGGI
jgi:N-acyl homoserine lactone hydrolase